MDNVMFRSNGPHCPAQDLQEPIGSIPRPQQIVVLPDRMAGSDGRQMMSECADAPTHGLEMANARLRFKKYLLASSQRTFGKFSFEAVGPRK